MSKQNGFTLIEILIALSIIGVIAAITIPSLLKSTTEKKNEMLIKSTITDIETAINSMMYKEDVELLTETYLYQHNSNSDKSGVRRFIKYLANIREVNNTGNTLILKNGAEVRINPSDENIIPLIIDVDGFSKGKATRNVDQFHYQLRNNGKLRYIEE